MQGLTNDEWQSVRDLILTDQDAHCVTCGAGPYSQRSLNYHVDQGGECNLCFDRRREVWPETLDIQETINDGTLDRMPPVAE